jgi:hypothetical protein
LRGTETESRNWTTSWLLSGQVEWAESDSSLPGNPLSALDEIPR